MFQRGLTGQADLVDLPTAEIVPHRLQFCTKFVKPPVTVAANPLCRGTCCCNRVILAADSTHPGAGILPVVKTSSSPSTSTTFSSSTPSTTACSHTAPSLTISACIVQTAFYARPFAGPFLDASRFTNSTSWTEAGAIRWRGGWGVRGHAPLPICYNFYLETFLIVDHIGIFGWSDNHSGISWLLWSGYPWLCIERLGRSPFWAIAVRSRPRTMGWSPTIRCSMSPPVASCLTNHS